MTVTYTRLLSSKKDEFVNSRNYTDDMDDDDKQGELQQTNNARTMLSYFVKSAAELRGLAFGNKIDSLLPEGALSPNTLTFIYGKRKAEQMANILCGNAVRIFGGNAIFIDASNSFDPYAITRHCAMKSKRSSESEKTLLQSIIVSRAFTCYQLTDLVVGQLTKLVADRQKSVTPDAPFHSIIRSRRSSSDGGNNNIDHQSDDEKISPEETRARIKLIVISGISNVFNEEEDITKNEIERLQYLMASSLHRIASSRKSDSIFIVASSKDRCGPFIEKSDVVIKLFDDEKSGAEKAALIKHNSRRSADEVKL
jgi:hypothetical protein